MWQYFGAALMSDILWIISFYYVIYILRRICREKKHILILCREIGQSFEESL